MGTEEADDPSSTANVQDDLALQGLFVLQYDAVVLGCARLVSQHLQVQLLQETHTEGTVGLELTPGLLS